MDSRPLDASDPDHLDVLGGQGQPAGGSRPRTAGAVSAARTASEHASRAAWTCAAANAVAWHAWRLCSGSSSVSSDFDLLKRLCWEPDEGRAGCCTKQPGVRACRKSAVSVSSAAWAALAISSRKEQRMQTRRQVWHSASSCMPEWQSEKRTSASRAERMPATPEGLLQCLKLYRT